MRIQNNVMAMNTHRMYTINNSNIQKSAEKLSSGYRINRAGDDAAGLAISEKMRSQIRGLGMASKNSQDAISLVQTAEGALQEVHSMLQRMNELSVQSATGTNQELDRNQLAKEFNQLKREINDIAEQTTFNNMKILDGSLSNEGPQRSAQTAGIYATSVEEPAKAATKAQFTIDLAGVAITNGSSTITGVTVSNLTFAATVTDGDVGGTDASDEEIVAKIAEVINAGSAAACTLWDVVADGTKLTFISKIAGTGAAMPGTGTDVVVVTGAGVTAAVTQLALEAANITEGEDAIDARTSTVIEFDATKLKAGDMVTLNVGDANNTILTAAWQEGDDMESFLGRLTSAATGDLKDNIDIKGSTLTIHGEEIKQETIDAGFIGAKAADKDFGTMRIQVGALESEQLNIEVKSMNSFGLGLDESTLADQDGAGKAITSTRSAINMVSDQRSLLGAMQNRLEHKISNLDNTAENLQSAESRIRDVDVAKEMTNYTKNNILAQASTAMLAQANAAPQSVLSLLQ